MNIKNKAVEMLDTAKTYWKTPPLGRFMNYREIFAYSVGGIGVYFIFTMCTTIMLSTTNVIIGNTIGISPTHMYAMFIASVIINIPLTGLRAGIIDGVRSQKGKYRPYLLATGVPTALLSCGFVFVPYEKIEQEWVKIAVIMAFNIGLQFFYNFFYEAYENLIFVLSPNTMERSDVITIKSVTYSLAPSIMNPLIPLVANIVSNGDIYNLKVYRWLYPPIAIIGIFFTVFVYAWTEEKIVQAKTHVIQIRFTDALKAVAKNKYFWIISLAGWIGFLENSWGSIHSWLYQYDASQNVSASVYALMIVLISNASLWGMLSTPFLIRKLGKRGTMILSNVMNIVFIGMMYPFVHNIWMIVACIWLNYMVGAFAVVLNPAINADIRDYQHYISGERIDGMFASVGLIGSFITLVTSGVLPMVYEKYGINEHNGLANMYDVLYDTDVLYTLVRVLIILGVVGATANVIPYFFYDLTEKKQKGMVSVLKLRALFEDYGNDALSDSDLVVAIDMVNRARELNETELAPVTKDGIKAAKASGSRAAVREAKNAYREAKALADEKDVSAFIMSELNKFSDSAVMQQLAAAKKAAAQGYGFVYTVERSMLDSAKSLPKNTEEEKKFRKSQIEYAKMCLDSKKAALKHYPNGIEEFDKSVFDKLFDEEDEINLKIRELSEALFNAKKEKNTEKTSQLKREISALKAKKKEIEKDTKKATKEYSVFNHAAKPYLQAVKLIKQQENYSRFDDIAAMYDEAKARADAEEERRREQAEREKAEAKAYAEKLKAEKKSKKK